MSSKYSPWPFYLGGWTSEEPGAYQPRKFASEAEMRSAIESVATKVLVNKGAKPDGYEIEGYICRASFQPQTSEVGESPSLTGPWAEHQTKKWSEVETFIAKHGAWPFVSIEAMVTRFEIEQGTGWSTRTLSNFPVHIFYRRSRQGN